MQRYNEPAEGTSPRSPRSLDILDSPSEQPRTPRRGSIRQPILIDSPSGEDDVQLADVSRIIRDFIREIVDVETFASEVRALRGHQDLKDMIPENMEYIPMLRRLADMLALIQSKQDALVSSAAPPAPAAEFVYDSDDMDAAAEGSGLFDPIEQPDEESELDYDSDDYASLMGSDDDDTTDVSYSLRF